MDKILITSASAPPGGPYSPGLAVGEWVVLAGQTGAGEAIEDQAGDALRKITSLLGEAGCTLDDVVSCHAHLADLSAFQRFDAVYERYFPGPRPVRTTVGAALPVIGPLGQLVATGDVIDEILASISGTEASKLLLMRMCPCGVVMR